MLPKFTSCAFLAPMAGVSDPALRLQCKMMGAGLVVTELTSIHGIIARSQRLESDQDISNFIEFDPKERPLSIQLFGSDLESLSKAAKIVEPFFDIIDYNMGCPAPHITQQMAGAALLQEIDITRQIFETLVSSVRLPVTLKIRAGITSTTRYLFRDVSKIAEDQGVEMITFHPRTVHQGYSGKADWNLIRELKSITDIPIVGNGDINTPEDAAMMLNYTKCDYIMVGRAAMGNPFIFEQINDYLNTGTYTKYTDADRLTAFFEYLKLSRFYNIKFSNIKGQAIRFTKGLRHGSKIRSRITQTKDISELQNVMQVAYDL